jgi:hypothetical protein
MKEKIKEIQDYFIGKILSDEFEVINMGEHVIEILVDGEYKFAIWAANTPENRKPYHSAGYEYFIQLKFNEKQALECHSLLKKRIDNYNNITLRKEKEAQYIKLKNELGIQ